MPRKDGAKVSIYKLLEIAKGKPIINMGAIMKEANKAAAVQHLPIEESVKEELLSYLAAREMKKFIGLLKDHFIALNPGELREIKDKRLYLALPIGEEEEVRSPRAMLEYAATGRVAESLRARDVAVEDVMYVAMALDKSGEEAYFKIDESIPKLKAVFGDDLKSFEGFIKSYEAAYPSEKDIISKAAESVEWKDTGKVLEDPRWRGLLADPRGRGIVDQLIYRYEEFNEKFEDDFPNNIDELLQKGLELDCPLFLEKLASLRDEDLPEKWPRSKVVNYAREHYKLDLKSTGEAESNGRTIDEAMLLALDVIINPERKKRIEGRKDLPDIAFSGEEAAISINEAREGVDRRFIQTFPEALQAKVQAALQEDYRRSREFASDYTLRLLDPDDPKGFYLGKLTNCCQSIDGTSKEVVEYGMTQRDSGFYVIEDKRGRVRGQGWAWISEDGKSIVIDSFEKASPEVSVIFEVMLSKLRDRLLEEGFENVFLGIGNTVEEMRFEKTKLSTRRVRMPVREGFLLNDKGLLYGDSLNSYDLSAPSIDDKSFFYMLIKENKVELFREILASTRDIHSLSLGYALDIAARKKNKSFVKEILNSERAINSRQLGEALIIAVEKGDLESAEEFISSTREIDPRSLGNAVRVAMKNGELKFIHKILVSGRELPERIKSRAIDRLEATRKEERPSLSSDLAEAAMGAGALARKLGATPDESTRVRRGAALPKKRGGEIGTGL
ncbi:MAG: hypothetical protein RLN62_05340 [Rickettsiales bacterium]